MKVAINGFGRIGRLVFRIMMEDPYFDVVAMKMAVFPCLYMVRPVTGDLQGAMRIRKDSHHLLNKEV